MKKLISISLFLLLSQMSVAQHLIDSVQVPFHASCGLDAHAVLLGARTSPNSSTALPTTAYPANAIINCGRFELYFDDILISTAPNTQPPLGFADPAGGVGAIRINTLCNVLTYIQNTFDFSQIPSGTPIRINVAQSLTPGLNPSTVGWLGIANPGYVNTGTPHIINGFIYDYATSGIDPIAATNFHATITFNFDQIVPTSGAPFPITWQEDNTTPFINCNYDLFSVMLHEVTHAMGWFSLVNLAPTLPGSILGNDQYSGIDYTVHQGGVLPNTLIKMILGPQNNPNINPAIAGNANGIQNNDLWINNLTAPDNYPVYSGLSPGAPANSFALGSVISHLDQQSWVYSLRERISPGDQQYFVMGPARARGEIQRTYSKGEIQTLVSLGYNLNPAFAIANQNVIPNRLPFSTRMAGYTNYLVDNFPDIVPADFPPLVNNIGSSVVINLAADPTLTDADGDPISVYPNSIYNIRGCGNGGNNHNCLTVAGQQITFTPRPGFFGRAQFGFNLFDGKEIGGFVIYTIDVLKGNNTPACAPGTNLVVNGGFEEGTEVKRLGPEENLANDYYEYQLSREGRFRRGTIFGDGQRLNYSDANALSAWPTTMATVYVGNSWINCNGTVFTSDIVSPTFPSAFGLLFPLNAMAVTGGQRYYNAHLGYYHNFDLCADLQNCHTYNLEFDYYSSNAPINAGGPVNFTFGFGNTTNVPYNTVWPNPVPTNYSFNSQLNSLNAGWQHVVIPFNYCSSANSDLLNIAHAGPWTDFYIDNLSITEDLNPPAFAVNITTTPANGIVCSNNNAVTLTANVSNSKCTVTYNWLPGGQTTQTINDNPTVTTNYQVTVSDGCSTLVVNTTIIVNQPATVNVTASPQTICAGFSSNLSVSPGLTGTIWNPGSLPGNNVVVSPGSSTTYNVTGTDGNGCQVNGSVLVNVVNCCTAPNTLAANYSASTIITGGGLWAPSTLNTIVSGGILTLQNINVTMPMNSKITVMPGCTLRIDLSNLWACTNDMWDGIEVMAGGRVEIYNSSRIEDAKIGAHLLNTSTVAADFLIYNSFFNKNNKGIVLDPFNGTHPGIIYNTTFQSIPSTLTPNSSMATLATTKNPFAGRKTAKGIEINTVGQVSIGSLAGTNIFNGIELGIHSTRSNLYSIKNDFTGIVYTICGTGFCPPVCSNTGICILAENKGTLHVGETPSAAIATNNFSSSANGVVTRNNINVYVLNNKFINMNAVQCYASNCVNITNNLNGENITVNKNDFNNFRNGVYVNTFTKNAVNINQNTFKHNPKGLGIYCLQNSFSTLSIQLNDFNGLPANQGNTAIRVQNTSFVTNGITKILSNTVKRTINGIVVSGYSKPIVSSNDVKYYHSSAPSNTSFGIWMLNSASAKIEDNTVSNNVIANSSYVNKLYGIAIDPLCQSSFITNNTTTNMASGMRFSGTNLPLKLSCNFMTRNFYGLEMQADIGDQGLDPTNSPPNGVAQDNQWTLQNNAGSTGALRVGTPAQRNWFYRQSGLPWMLNPTVPSQMTPVFPGHAFFLGTPIVGSAPYNCLYGCAIPSACKTIQVAKLAKKQAPFDLQIPTDRVATVESSYREILHDSTIYQSGLTSFDSTVIAFRDSVSLTNIGAFQEVATRLEAGDTAGARILNLSIQASSTDCNESDRKTLNGIYLRTWARGIFEFTPQDSAILKIIANKKVDLCGTVVYDARVMMRIDLNDYPVNTGGPGSRFSDNTSIILDEVGVMYPNPAQNKAYYETILKETESGFILLFDVLGTQVDEERLNSGFNRAVFDLSNLPSGVYFYRVIVNAEIRSNNKLIITK